MPDADPLDFSDEYNTKLSPQEERSFQAWTGAQSDAVGRNVGNDNYDYDLRGWWKANPGVDLSGAHLTDTYKKPNHPTFSDQSQYHGVDGYQGGSWGKTDGGSWSFTPGSTNFFSAPELGDYFKRVEPTNQLILPQS